VVAVLPLLDLAAKLVPRIEASNAGCIRPLPCNLQNVAKAVGVKPAHCGEVGGKGFGVSLLLLLDEGLDVGRDYFFRGLLLLLIRIRGGRGDGCSGDDGVHGCLLLGLLHWPLPLNRGGGVYIHAERLLAKAGCSNCKERGISHHWNGAQREWKGRSKAEGCTSEARKPRELPLAALREGRCGEGTEAVTKLLSEPTNLYRSITHTAPKTTIHATEFSKLSGSQ
jgi:hypothetical protein